MFRDSTFKKSSLSASTPRSLDMLMLHQSRCSLSKWKSYRWHQQTTVQGGRMVSIRQRWYCLGTDSIHINYMHRYRVGRKTYLLSQRNEFF